MEIRNRITDSYREYLLENGQAPASVYLFCKKLSISEREFFERFANFHAVEGSIWAEMLEKVKEAQCNGSEWVEFSAHQRYLTFLYSFVEKSLEMRSLMLMRFPSVSVIARNPALKLFEAKFKSLAAETIAHGVEKNEIAPRGILESLYPEVFYIHFRVVIDFLLRDDSHRFERTDAFIEKSVTLAFDVIRTQVLDSAWDLARFLTPDFWARAK